MPDDASNFRHAWRHQCRAKNFLHKDSEHHGHIHMSGGMSSNQTEFFNGDAPRAKEKVVRGIKGDDSIMLGGRRSTQLHKAPLGLDGDTQAYRTGT